MTIQVPDDARDDQDAPLADAPRALAMLRPRDGLASSPLQVGGDFVFIDSRVPDIQVLIGGATAGERVFVIDSDRNGLAQIAGILAVNRAQNLSSISIVSHGSVGELEIGSTILNDATLSSHADALSAIGAALQPGGDVQLFSCNTAQGAAGQQFLGDLSSFLGGADVSASTHAVGSASAGGSFLLDSATGAIDAVSPFTSAATDAFDGTLSGTVSGQLWYGMNGSQGGSGSIDAVGHINSDASSPTTQGTEDDAGEVQPKAVGVDTAAGFYFQTNDSSALTISAYNYTTGNIVGTNGTIIIGNTAQGDIVNALAVDPVHNTIYVGRWGVDLAHSGIIKLTYNPSTGALDTTAAFNASPNFIVHNNAGVDDIRGIAVDPVNQVIYFTVCNDTFASAPFSFTNGLWRVNQDGTGLTQMTSAAQFPASIATSQQKAIGPVAFDAAKGLVYFETSDIHSGGTGAATLWEIASNASGGTATQVSLPGGTVLAYGDSPQGGLSIDNLNQQIYIVTQSGTSAGAADQVLVGQLSAAGTSITSFVQTYSYATLNGHANNGADHITGAMFNQLPVLTIAGNSTAAVEQSASILALNSASSSDDSNYSGATVQITGGTFSSNETSANDDSLTINGLTSGTANGITFSYNSATETMTLTGYASAASYNTTLALVKYNTTGDNPTNYGSNTTRTVTWTISDGSLNIPSAQQNSGTTTLNITGVNDAAVLATGATISYTEQAAAATIDSAITVSDADNLNQASATVVISANFQTGDVLAANTTGTSITASYSAGTHTLTLSGSDTLAHYQQVLRTVTFANTTNDDPTVGGTVTARTIAFTTNDGTTNSNTINATVNITAVNDAPTAASPGTHYSATEQISLSLKNTGLSVSDVDGGSEVLTLTVGEGTLTAAAGTSGVAIGNNGTASITLTGTIAQINAFLNTDGTSTLSYVDNTNTPSASTTLGLSINDNGHTGTGGSLVGTSSSTIDITAVNDAPTATAPTAHYGATVSVTLNLKNTGLSVADTDSGSASETLTISVVEGTLNATAGGSGAGVAGDGTGTLAITGTIAQINAFLNTDGTSTLSYIDNNGSPPPTATLSLSINDNGHTGTGGSLIGTASATIDIDTPNNDPPVIIIPGANYSATEQVTLNLKNSGLSVSDVDGGSGSETLTISVGEGTLTASAGTSGAGISGNGTGTLTLTGTIAQLNAFLNTDGTSTFTYIDNTDTPSSSTTLSLNINDNGNTGTGGAQQDNKSIGIDITAVNDAPIAVSPGTHYSATEQTTLDLKNTGISVSDVDSGGASETLTISVGEGTLNATAGTSGVSVSGSGTGSLTIDGTISQINAFLAIDGTSTFTYIDNTDTPSASTTLSVSINDNGNTGAGGAQVGSSSSTIDITAINDAPTATAAVAAYSATEQVSLDLKNTGMSVADPDGGGSSETLTISVGEGTLTATAGNSGASIGGSGTGTITVGGTIAQINAFLNTATSTFIYVDNTDTPSASTTLSMSINDNGHTGTGGAQVGSASQTINITAVNDAPVVANAGSTIGYTEGNAPVTLESALTISDVDSANLVGATISLSGFFAGDELKINGATSGDIVNGGNTIHFSYNTGTGTLSLSGSDTVADYQAAMRLVTYDSTSLNPTNYGALPSRDVGWTVNDGAAANNNSTPVDTTINITAVDSPAVAQDDSFAVDEYTAFGAGFDLFNNNGHGVDFDPDNTSLSIASVAGGPGANVGTQFTLNSGALLTVQADGTLVYDPNHAFDSFHLAGPTSGAANITTTDTFSYTLVNGGSATVTVTIYGRDDANSIYQGTAGNDTIHGGSAGNFYDLSQGGDDTVTGGIGNDSFKFLGTFDSNDHVNGGGGTNDQIGLQGDYSGGLTLSGSFIQNIQVIALLPGFNYTLSSDGTLTAPGQAFVFWSVTMGSGNHVSLDMHQEAGNFVFYLGQGDDTAIGGSGNDVFYGEGGKDTLTGNGGADIFAWLSAAESSSTTYDSFDFTAGTDKVRLGGGTVATADPVTAIDAGVFGALSTASFDSDLAAVLGNGQVHELDQHHAVIFTATSGTLNGHVFLIVGTAAAATGYVAGSDYVFDVTTGSNLGALATTDFLT